MLIEEKGVASGACGACLIPTDFLCLEPIQIRLDLFVYCSSSDVAAGEQQMIRDAFKCRGNFLSSIILQQCNNLKQVTSALWILLDRFKLLKLTPLLSSGSHGAEHWAKTLSYSDKSCRCKKQGEFRVSSQIGGGVGGNFPPNIPVLARR